MEICVIAWQSRWHFISRSIVQGVTSIQVMKIGPIVVNWSKKLANMVCYGKQRLKQSKIVHIETK